MNFTLRFPLIGRIARKYEVLKNISILRKVNSAIYASDKKITSLI